MEGKHRKLGPYELLTLLGQGGMASVHIAKGPNGRVAIKLLHPQYARDPDQVTQFRAEARVATTLSHPRLIRGLDAGEVDGQHYLALELVPGPTLQERLREEQPPPHEVLPLIVQVLDGLEHMHREGFVHCDANPQNVLYSAEDAVKLGDFGVATTVGVKQKSVRGTYSYMSPEQARGRAVDGRSDQYAVAVLLWEILAGKRLFKRSASHLSLAATVEHEPAPLPDPDWNRIAQRALAKDPEERYPTCADLAADIRDKMSTPT